MHNKIKILATAMTALLASSSAHAIQFDGFLTTGVAGAIANLTATDTSVVWETVVSSKMPALKPIPVLVYRLPRIFLKICLSQHS